MFVNNVYEKLRLFLNFCVIFGGGGISHYLNDTIYEPHFSLVCYGQIYLVEQQALGINSVNIIKIRCLSPVENAILTKSIFLSNRNKSILIEKTIKIVTHLPRFMISGIAIVGWVSGMKYTRGVQIFLLCGGRNMGYRSISCGAPL